MVDLAAPWGLSTLGFAIVYSVGVGALWVVLGLAQRGVGRAVLPSPMPELDVAELAYLHDGEDRLAETEVARLIAQHELEIRTEPTRLVAAGQEIAGQGTAGQGAAGERTGVTGVILHASQGSSEPSALIRAARRSGEMAPIVNQLRNKGLIGSARNRAIRRWAPSALAAAWLVMSVLGLISVPGFVSVDLDLPQPWSLLLMIFETLLMGGALFVHFAVSVACVNDTCAFVTPAGRAIVAALGRVRRRRGSGLDYEVLARYGPELSGPVGTVAVSGLYDYPDPKVREALQELNLSSAA